MSEIKVDYVNGNFQIRCPFHLNDIPQHMPDRKFRKGTNSFWQAPALRRNIEYLKRYESQLTLTDAAAEVLRNFKMEDPRKKITSFPSWYRFKTEPMAHQHKILNKGWGLKEFAILAEQGTGKSKCAIDICTAHRMNNDIDGVVVVCPSSIKFVWGGKGEELDIHCPIPFQAHVLTAGNNDKAIDWINKKHDFPWLIIGIEALSQGGAHEVLSYFVRTRRVAFVIDESSRIKTPGAICTDRVIEIGRYAEYRYIMTGTPVTQGLQDLYTQYAFLDENILGFQSFYSFRNYFCVMGGFENKQIVGFTNSDELLALIDPYSVRVTKDEAMPNLPEKVKQVRYVEPTKEQAKAYKELSKQMKTEVAGEEISVDSVLEKTLRLQQIAGGFYATKIGVKPNGQPVYDAKPIPGKNPKLEELVQTLDDIWPTSGGKAVVFTWSRPEIAMIAARLRKEGYKVVEFHGGVDGDECEKAKHDFQNGDAEIFLATQKKAQMGLTLTICRYVIYFSNDYSLERRLQSEDRCHRKGSEIHESVVYIDLAMRGTVDNNISTALRNKKSLADVVSDVLKSGKLSNFLSGDVDG